MTAIILLNWNGYEDTIACLDSLYKIENSDYFVIVVDNGSDNNSLDKISEWIELSHYNYCFIKEGEKYYPNIDSKTVILYSLAENYGFAKGNNIGIELAKKYNPMFYLLLNNDTIVEKDFLMRLVSFQELNSQYKVLSPLILYYDSPQLIWNAGGKLLCGFRKCYYDNKHMSALSNKTYFAVSFVTGCALFIHNCIVSQNQLLTEDFFFGEEDFNFCIRMKRNGVKMCCLPTSVIYHKVSSSTSEIQNFNKVYLYYLNRFIDIKNSYNSVFFFLWKCVSIPYMISLLLKLKYTSKEIIFLIKQTLLESKNLRSVSKATFTRIMFTNLNP